ncbi:hypothetical protein PLESTF_001752900 [Pleodorina starrii]|nr:hypothetical protein PLESTF_001752900 [Pleodorina starrii]
MVVGSPRLMLLICPPVSPHPPAPPCLEPFIGASLILPIFWAEEASEISAVQAATFHGGVYRTHAARRVVPRGGGRPGRRRGRITTDDASGITNGGGATSATDRLRAGSSSGAPVAAPLPVPAPVAAASTAAFSRGRRRRLPPDRRRGQ